MVDAPRTFTDELSCGIWGIDDPASAAWLRVRLSQDRPAELARVEAHWPLLEDHERQAIYDEVLEGDTYAIENSDARVPAAILADYHTLVYRASAIVEA